uniref:Ribosomal protein L16 n=1 Tax=Thorea hispida TaxID=202687 RepID=A0A1Z1XAS4_9FLOR|nr:ribosomal protein L16 [Thorea hispida]ARX95962.1 ribosomal protein L16 [Thorea hispida]
MSFVLSSVLIKIDVIIMSLRIEKKLHNNWKVTKTYKNYTLQSTGFGIKSTDFKVLTETQLLSLKSSLYKKLKTLTSSNITKVHFSLPLNSNLTSLGLESRMGKGKGNILTRLSVVRPGQIIITFSEISWSHIIIILKFIKIKLCLGVKLTFIKY